MITNPEGIKKLCVDEITERLRHRPIHPNLIELQLLKEKLSKKRIEIAKHIKTKPWSLKDLDRVLQKLKNGKCRDPQGFINKLFKRDVAGKDFKDSLLCILNKTKEYS